MDPGWGTAEYNKGDRIFAVRHSSPARFSYRMRVDTVRLGLGDQIARRQNRKSVAGSVPSGVYFVLDFVGDGAKDPVTQ